MIRSAKNQIFITLDSLRWDTFVGAGNLFIKKYPYVQAQTHGTYTLPAHMAFFSGKLPCTTRGVFDTCARSGRQIEGTPIWRLKFPESSCPADFTLEGQNIVQGFRKKGYITIGTGAVSWFDTSLPAQIPYLKDFDEWRYFGKFCVAEKQRDWVNQFLDMKKPEERAFIFMNFGETHSPYIYGDHKKHTTWKEGFAALSHAQMKSLQFLDSVIETILVHPNLRPADIIICGDHGDCFGEDGMFGHSFSHPMVMTVPMIRGEIRL